jgi:hypothetical protein
MDTATQMAVIAQGVGAGVLTINGGRADLNEPPLDGGNTAYLQQQYYPLESLADREPPDTSAPPVVAQPQQAPPADDEETQMAKALARLPINTFRAKCGLAAR